MSDLIDRQDAIYALRTHERKASNKWFDNQLDIEWNNAIDICCYDIENLPSAQPEPLTGKEKMIFLAAMAKEENICKQIDDECRNCREPYEDSLVRTCHEITRKVKGALWTI